MNSKVFVGNIHYDYEEKSWLETLSIVGPVKSYEIKKEEGTDKSRGFGFVEYTDPEIAASALRNLNNIDYKGRQLRINTQEHDKNSIRSNSEAFKAYKDISYIKQSENEDVKLSNIVKGITDDQKLWLWYSMKTIMQKDPTQFTKVLMNQNDEVWNSIWDWQNSFIEKNK